MTALLMTMSKPIADRIIGQFEDGDIRVLARSAIELPPIDLATMDRLVADLADRLHASGAVEGSASGARSLLEGVISEDEVGEIMGEASGLPPTLIWRRLDRVADEKLTAFIESEQPQVAAYVLSRLGPDKASCVLDKLDAGLRAELSMRLVTLKPVGDVAAKLLAQRLGSDLLAAAEATGCANNHALLGAILNKLDRAKSMDILSRLSADRPDDARKVRKYVFGFEDVVDLSPADRARLFEEVPTERVVLALRRCNPELAARVLDALPPRARRLVDSELANDVKVADRSVDEARRSIADLALALAERSVIVLPVKDEPARA